MGGLGNQLFQIFAVVSHAIDHGMKYWFEYEELLRIGTVRPTYWNTIFKNISNTLVYSKQDANALKSESEILNEPKFSYTPLPTTRSNLYINGYFQSELYFINNFSTIYNLLDIDNLKNIVKQKLRYDTSAMTSMHFRIGDSVMPGKAPYHPIINYPYFRNALKQMIDDTSIFNHTVLYFCEEVDNDRVKKDIDNLQTEFPLCTFIKAPDDLSDWEQMILMSCCKNNIIANSTFSWWSAYLNTHESKKVMYPSIWFGPALSHHDLSTLIPKTWIKIDAK